MGISKFGTCWRIDGKLFMKSLFEYVKTNVLHGMPSGCLVTKDNIDFDIGMWQHKTYDYSSKIYSYLRSKWTPHTINLMILDESCIDVDLKTFMEDNSFEFKLRNMYLVYCIAIKSDKVTSDLCHCLKTQKYVMNAFHEKIIYENYTIFVCDFVKNLLYY